jgi:hypothetical protein
MIPLYKAITPLGNENCRRVKVGDFNVFFCADYGSKICFAVPLELSEEQAHLE